MPRQRTGPVSYTHLDVYKRQQVVLGSQFPAAAVVFGFAEQLAVGAVEVGGDAFGGELDDALAEEMCIRDRAMALAIITCWSLAGYM